MVIAVSAAIAFGLYPPAAQLAYAHSANVSLVIIFTTFVRAISLVLFCRWKGLSLALPSEKVRSIVSAGFFQALSVIGIISSLQFIPGPVTITIIFSSTSLLLVYLWIIGERKPNLISGLTTVTALIGVALTVGFFSTMKSTNLFGVALASVAALATTSRIYLYGKEIKDYHPAILGAQVFSIAFAVTVLFALYEVPKFPTDVFGWYGILASALSLVLGTFGMFYGIQSLGSFRFSLFLKLEPAFTSLFSILILHQFLLPLQYLGMCVVLISLLTFSLYGEKK